MKSKKLFFTFFLAVFMTAAILSLFLGNAASVFAATYQQEVGAALQVREKRLNYT